MSHEFTDEQLQLTILDASDQRSIFIRTARELEDIDSSAIQSLRTLLYHLPEPGKTYITNVGIQQQIGRLQDLTSSEHEAVIWLSTLNHLVATGADRKRILKQDTQDGWQECAWGDVLHTDERVKAEYISGTIIEGIPDGISDEGIHLVDSIFMPHSTDAKWHRIPAPVQHPDPADNQFIIANGKKYVIFGDRYYNIEQVGIYGITGYFPEEFTSWEPADIVAKVIADE